MGRSHPVRYPPSRTTADHGPATPLGRVRLTEVLEDLANARLLGDEGDDAHLPAALPAQQRESEVSAQANLRSRLSGIAAAEATKDVQRQGFTAGSLCR
jgi:hypothetical protein